MKFLENLRGQAILDWKNDEIKKAWEIGVKQRECGRRAGPELDPAGGRRGRARAIP